MHEILFRGKRLDNGEWIEGYYLRIGLVANERAYIVPYYASTLYTYEVDPDTVCQFTGEVDKNGKRVFEGDVVRYDSRTGYVNFGTGCFCVQDSKTQSNPAIDIVMFSHDVTVIGNIHDHELLEVSEDG